MGKQSRMRLLECGVYYNSELQNRKSTIFLVFEWKLYWGDGSTVWWITYRVSSFCSSLIGFFQCRLGTKLFYLSKIFFIGMFVLVKCNLFFCRFGLLKSCMEIKSVNSIIVFHTIWSSLCLKILIRMLFFLSVIVSSISLSFTRGWLCRFYSLFSILDLPFVMGGLVKYWTEALSEPDYVI